MSRKKQMNGTAAEVEAAFYDALSRADVEALMALWADDEEIVCVHPGGARLIGHAAIRSSWEEIFKRGAVHIHPVNLHATHNLMCSIHNIVEEIGPAPAGSQEAHILATNVYVKTPQGWRIVVHHASIAAGKAPIEPLKSATLH